MSTPAASLPIHGAHVWLQALLRVGLHHFAVRYLPEPSPVFAGLATEAERMVGHGGGRDWEQWQARTRAVWPGADGPCARLLRDLELDLPQAFVMGLAGEVEASHLVTMAVAELQAPAASCRPSVHLAVALVEELFGAGSLSAQDFHDLAVLREQLLWLEGESPLPLRNLRMSPGLWAVLCERQVSWQGCRPVARAEGASSVPAELRPDLNRLAGLLDQGQTPGLVVRGPPGSGRAHLAAELAAAMGRQALEVPVEQWEQDPALRVACRYAGWLPVLRPTLGPGEVWRPPATGESAPLLVLLGGDGAVESSRLLEVAAPLPSQMERAELWTRHLGDEALARESAATALVGGPAIEALARNARLLAERSGEELALCHIAIARRQWGAERLRLLAQPVDRRVDADALVLPASLQMDLDEMVRRARCRESLWQGLGVTLRATPNPGLRALFVGQSGTGKTLAASYVATALGAPLYRVDLAAVMNKYIGESEKNLAALLDQAAATDVVLLFDEADSLFGRRTEGKETGERYANMLTNFLLSRIETHPGIVLLTTNSRERIDSAFTRRLDVIAEFPLPGFAERLRLWRSHLGERGPGDQIYGYLASCCDLAGGQIRNVVLGAAAQAESGRITEQHLLRGLEVEYRKLGRSMPAKLARLGSQGGPVTASGPGEPG